MKWEADVDVVEVVTLGALEFEPCGHNLHRAARSAQRVNGRFAQELSRQGALVSHHLIHGAEGDDFPSVASCLGAEIDDPIGPAHRFLIVFDDDQRIALCGEFPERVQESLVIAGVQSDRGFVEDIEDAAQIRTKLGRETDALRFSAAEGLGGAVELQVVEAYAAQEL